jgi:tripeptidyl-peptidase I
MLSQLFLAVLAFSSTTFAFPASGSSISKDVSLKSVREKLASPPRGWVKDASAKFDKDFSMMSLRIHLVHQNMDKFHDLASNVGTLLNSRESASKLKNLDRNSGA